MFSMFTKTKKFDVIFPSFVPYIKSKDEQDEFTNNLTLIDKYNKNKNLIDAFLNEVAKFHKHNKIYKFIFKYFKELDNVKLSSFLMLYLNLSEKDKKDGKFFEYYDDKNGLSEKSEDDVKLEIELDKEYESIKTGEEKFAGEDLDIFYKISSIEDKKFIVSLLRNNGWDTFVSIFEDRYRTNFKQIVILLNLSLIDGSIINQQLESVLGENMFKQLVYSLLSNRNLEIAKYIKTLIQRNRFDLIIGLIEDDLISDEVFINIITNEKDDENIISLLEGIKVKKQINN